MARFCEGHMTHDDIATGWRVPDKYTGYAAPKVDGVPANAQVIWSETK